MAFSDKDNFLVEAVNSSVTSC